MPRAATTSDPFNAIAEPRRRDLINALSTGQDFAVNDLVHSLRLPQPTVSKHLSVLRKVGLVTVTKRGQQRLYSLHAQELKRVHDWVKNFAQFWDAHLLDIKQIAERKAKEPEEPAA